ncbi:MAG: amino acid adenylation domain-containing protein [Nannocystaceae bacterium]
MLRRQVRLTPDGAALRFGDGSLSYAQLYRWVLSLAHELRGHGVGAGGRVGVCMERSAELVASLWAVLEVGAAYVPLDPEYPPTRVGWLLDDAKPLVILAQPHLVANLPPSSALLMHVSDRVDDTPRAPVAPASDDDAIAYIIFTSGSTGRPKGVMNTHAGITNRLLWMQQAFGLRPGERVLQKTPFSFDVSVWEFFWPLITGATVVVAEPGGHRDPAYLTSVIKRECITTLHFVPSMLAAFLDYPGARGCQSLRRVICSGEALDADLATRFFAVFPKTELHNLYGPTEAAVDVSHWACERGSQRSSLPIGRPIANTQLYVLDAKLRPLPVGATGELYIGGVQVALGYLNRDDLSRERFIADPFSGNDGGRLYRTGDRAAWLEDGTLDFQGRLDHQVKIRGMRIELSEIESALRGHIGVLEAAVVASADASGQRRLHAYVVAAPVPHSGDGAFDQWRAVFDEAYRTETDEGDDSELNLRGWNSSYTGQPIPETEMVEWVEQTVDRIAALKPCRVLEIGCGTGLILFRLAPDCERYVGLDLSPEAIKGLQGQLRGTSFEHRVELATGAAHELDALEGPFDTIIINSVIQFFPDSDYLAKVLDAVVARMPDGGRIFVGDVRNFDLLVAFHASIAAHRAEPTLKRAALSARVHSHVALDKELTLSPQFFAVYAERHGEIGRVDIALRQGPSDNEMVRFRYDAVLHVGDGHACHGFDRLPWSEICTLEALGRHFAGVGVGKRFTGIPNARLSRERALVPWLGDAASEDVDLAALDARDPLGGIEPYEVWQLAQAAGMRCDISYAKDDYAFDAVIYPGEPRVSLGAPLHRIVATEGAVANDTEAAMRRSKLPPLLRPHLQQSLPDSMLPARFTVLASLPLTANGKLDRSALPPPQSRLGGPAEHAGPRHEVETLLCKAWAEALGFDRVGIRDNFFDLGGDSILVLQIINHAAREGVSFTAAQLAQHQTIEALAAVSRRIANKTTPAQGRVEGAHTLTAMQKWSLAHARVDGNRANQVWSVDLRSRLDPVLVGTALDAVAGHHDAFRLRLDLSGDAPLAKYSREPHSVRLATFDHCDEADARLLEICEEAGDTLDLRTGPMLRCLLFERGPDRPQRLVCIFHQQVLDGVSARIFFEDLSRVCGQSSAGEDIVLPKKTTAFQRASLQLYELAQCSEVEAELEHWAAIDAGRLRVDHPEAPDVHGDAALAVVDFDTDTTHSLLSVLPRQLGCKTDDLLLAALSLALGADGREGALLVDTEGHGRDAPLEACDLARTIGVFSAMYPLRIDVSSDGDPVEALRRVRQSRDVVPGGGIGYGLLRYVHADAEVRRRLEEGTQASILFNYLGQFDQFLSADSAFSLIREPAGGTHRAQEPRAHGWELTLLVTSGRLRVECGYSQKCFNSETVHAFVDHYAGALKRLVETTALLDASSFYVPGDFPLAALDADTLPRATGSRPVEDIYPLTPLQRGMLFRAQAAPDSISYFVQLSAVLQGPSQLDLLEQAFQHAVARHPILRTRFVWKGFAHPLQVVELRATLPFTVLDLREEPQHVVDTKLDRMRGDLQAGYRLDRAPLMAVWAVRLDDQRTRLIWNFHHLLLDGWSMTDLLGEVFGDYAKLRGGQPLDKSAGPPFRVLVAWYAERDAERTAAFWRGHLGGFVEATPLPGDRGASEASSIGPHHKLQFSLAADETRALRRLASEARVTVHTLVQGTWGLLLSHWSGLADVVFGGVVPGRPALLPQVENIVGLFMNTLPVCVRFDPDQTLREFLALHQNEQFEAREYEHTALVDAQAQSQVGARSPLFESLISVQGYLREHGSLAQWAESLGLSEFEFIDWNDLPLSVAADVGHELAVVVKYDTARFDLFSAQRIAGDFEVALKLAENRLDLPLSGLVAAVDLARAGRARSARGALGRRNTANLAALRGGRSRVRVAGEPQMPTKPSIGLPRGPGGTRRRTVTSSARDWIRTQPLQDAHPLPTLVQPTSPGVDLLEWVRRERAQLNELLLEHRALLFRGFAISSPEAFRNFVEAASEGDLLEYKDRTTPRSTRGAHVYTSTTHPSDQTINQHNEGTYWLCWPRKLFFYCHVEPAVGGETPISDVRGVYRRVSESTRACFEKKKMMLVRNYNDGFGLPWQEVYRTKDRLEVEKYCRDNAIECEWKDGGRLRTRSVRPAVRRHPDTREPVWFNHAAFFHYTSLEPMIRQSLLHEFGMDDLPYATCYGDGTPIPTAVVAELKSAYDAETTMFRWRAGDVMLLDNMSVAHGRRPYEGEREVLVAMTEPYDGSEG